MSRVRIHKDCPRCGSGRIKPTAHRCAEDAVETSVSCLRCGFNVTVEDAYADYDTAISLWNKTKTPPDAAVKLRLQFVTTRRNADGLPGNEEGR